MILNTIDTLFFVLFAAPVLYLAFFAIGSVKRRKEPTPTNANPRSILVLIPAYKEDKVIMGCVEACLSQDYPKDSFRVVVISDGMGEEVNRSLMESGADLKEIHLENRTKSKALNAAFADYNGYDVALILDADNIIEPLFLQRINAAFNKGAVVVQGHRMAKNLNNSIAVLDAISEEINNSIFRKGHYNWGFSSALIGSGMAFEFEQFKAVMRNVDVVGGFDKELEHIYLMNGVKIHYLNDAYLLDEKIQRTEDFTKQRRRWMAAQFEHLARFFPLLTLGIKKKNLDFCDKLFQMLLLPRILILGGAGFFAVLFSIIDFELAEKWWGLLFMMVFTLFISVPRRLVDKKLLAALLTLPRIFIIVLLNLFKLKGANKKFLHTSHG